jgi:protein TonB
LPRPTPVFSLPERVREAFGRRAAGLVLALLAETLLVLALLTLAPRMTGQGEERTTTFTMSPERAEPSAPDEPAATPLTEGAAREAPPAERPAETPLENLPAPTPPPAPVTPSSTPPPVIPLSREQLAATDLALRTPPAAPPRRAVAGPPDRGSSFGADTPRVAGAGPNGEPLYAAAWYREPYPDELSGYLSTSRGPGWALIACRTVRDYRVEDCVKVDEYPEGSNIARSVLAAAWQFRVRPPRLGGESKIGEWVRIRIDYSMRER